MKLMRVLMANLWRKAMGLEPETTFSWAKLAVTTRVKLLGLHIMEEVRSFGSCEAHP